MEVISKEIQDWCYQLMRVDSRYVSSIIGVRSGDIKRRVFKSKSGVHKELFKSCMTLFNLVDSDIKYFDYYSCLFGVWNQVFWGDYIDGVLKVTVQGFTLEFKESGDNQFARGMARVLIKKGRGKQLAFMYVIYLFHYITCIGLCYHCFV